METYSNAILELNKINLKGLRSHRQKKSLFFMMLKLRALTIAIIIILLITIPGNSNQSTIIPDSQNPITMNNPYVNSLNSELALRFSLPADSIGFGKNMYVGVVFPVNISTNLNLGTSPIKHSCELNYAQPDTGLVNAEEPSIFISTEPELSLLSDVTATNQNHIAYCKIVDKIYSHFTAYSKFTLKIKFSSYIFPNKTIQQIGIFTSTTNNSEKIIIDSLYSFGSLGLYPNYTTSTSTVPLEVSSSALEVTTGPAVGTTTIYPYNLFKIKFTFKANKYIFRSDVNLVIQYPNDTISKFNRITSEDIDSTNPSQLALSGQLGFEDFGNKGVLITGINEDFYVNREFQITTYAWSALSSNINTVQSIIVLLYYKNSYTIYSYQKLDIIRVFPIQITSVINHPEYFDIYSNGAWPMRFKLTFNNDLEENTYLVLQHNNLIDNQRRWNFISSTCDFSENKSSYENAFGKRGNCLPLRNDFLYSGFPNTTTNYEGSGIMIKLINSFSQGDSLYLTVWGYADVCGTTYDPTASPNTTSFEKFSFSVKIFKEIKNEEYNENRIIYNTNIKIADGGSVTMGNVCWNSYVSGISNINQVGERRGNTISGTLGTDIMLFKEITDFVTFDASDTTCTSCFIYNAFTNSIISSGYIQNPNEKFLVSSTNAITSGSFFLLAALIPKSAAADRLSRYLATPRGGTANPYDYIPGKIQFQFSRKFLMDGNDYLPGKTSSCYVSWVAINDWTTQSNNGVVTHIPVTVPGTLGQQNFIHTDSMLDYNNTQLPPTIQTNTSKSTIYKIVSDYESSNSPAGTVPGQRSTISFFEDPVGVNPATAPTVPFGQFSIFTNCLRWASEVPEITSLFEYIDVQVQWISTQNNSDLSPVTKVNRFIKFYIQGGVFQDYTSNKYSWSGGVNIFHNHHAFSVSSTDYGICLLELNGEALANSSDLKTNSIILFMRSTVLIDPEVDDMSSKYPSAPLFSNISAYALQSSYTMSSENHYSKGINTTTVQSPNTYLDLIRDFYNQTPFLPNRTNYHDFLGSVLILNGITTNVVTSQDSTNPNLLIPYQCPYFSNTAGNTNKLILNNPTITIQWIHMTSHNAISRTANIINDGNNTVGGTNTSISNMVSLQDRKNSFNASGTKYNATLRFAQYSNSATNIDNRIYVYNGTNSATGTNVNCSAQILFTNSDIELASDLNISYFGTGLTQNTFATITNQKFRIHKKQFVRAVLSTSGTKALAPSSYTFSSTIITPLPLDSSYYFEGVMRPDISIYTKRNYDNSSYYSINDSHYLSSTDKSAFYCTSNTNTINIYVTNYINDGNVDNFILDYNPLTEVFTDISFTRERNEQLYNGDPGNHFLVSFTASNEVPVDAIIQLQASASVINNNDSACSIQNDYSFTNTENTSKTITITEQCTITSSIASCPISYLRSNFKICCHNILASDPISLNSLSIIFPSDPNITNISTYISTSIFTESNPATNFSFATNIASNDTITTIKSYIRNISYTHVSQERAIGKATFEIVLGRSLTSNMVITANTNLSNMKINNVDVSCLVGFGNNEFMSSNFDDGSGLLKSCYVDLSNTSSAFKVFTNKYIYQCGLFISSTVNVTLFPIYQINVSSNTLNSIIELTLETSDSNLANNSNINPLSSDSLDNIPEIVNTKIEDLCTVSLFPLIPNEYGVFIFEFNISLISFSNISKKINEITLFFPLKEFGYLNNSNNDDVLCLINNTILNCYWEGSNILNIYSEDLNISASLASLSLKIYKIKAPMTFTSMYFACSFNYYDSVSYKRINIVNGNGRLSSAISNSPTDSGYLRFHNISILNKDNISDSSPRNISTHKFEISIDLNQGITSFPKSITNSPFMILTFPDDYHLTIDSLVTNNNSDLQGTSNLSTSSTSSPIESDDKYERKNINKITLELYEYYLNTSETEITKSDTQVDFSFYQEGNNFVIYFTNSINLTNSFMYWEISVHNIINPYYTSISSTALITKPFKAVLSNSNYSSLFKTYTNTNQMSTTELKVEINSWLKYNRGYEFVFDNKKWITDVYTSPELNKTTLLPGRYKKLYFKNKTNTSVLMLPSTTNISIENDIFKMPVDYVTLPSSLYSQEPFYIGCSCDTPLGNYIIYFKSTGSNVNSSSTGYASIKSLYSYVVPLFAKIEVSKEVITWSAPSKIVRGGSAYVFFYLNEKTFSDIEISFSSNANSEIKTSIIKANTSYGRSIFSLLNTSTTTDQVFTPNDISLPLSNCFKFEKASLSFIIEGVAATIPNNGIKSSDFAYYNYDYLPELKKNSIKFTYNSVYRPVYIHCTLICNNMDYPTDQEIITQAEELKTSSVSYNDSTVLFYSGFVEETTTDAFDILFENLLRGQRYKLKCIVESNNYNSTLRTQSILEIESLSSATSEINNEFIPVSPDLTSCARIHFSSNPSNQTKTQLLYYCQYLYSVSGYYDNGCVICTDLYGNKAPGLEFPDINSCSLTNYIFKDYPVDNTTSTNSTDTSTSSYTVCPVAGLNCQSDVNGVKKFGELFKEFVDGVSTAANINVLLNISGVPVSSVETYDDSVAPLLQEKLGIDKTYINRYGLVQFALYYPTPLLCYFKIDNSTEPSFLDIQSCTNKNRCGVTYATTDGYYYELKPENYDTIVAGFNITEVEGNSTNTVPNTSTNNTTEPVVIEEGSRLLLRRFLQDSTTNSTNNSSQSTNSTNEILFYPGKYNIWLACYNDIPYPLKQSEVHSTYNFNINDDSKDCVIILGTDCYGNPVNPITYSRYIKLNSLFTIAIVIYLLF